MGGEFHSAAVEASPTTAQRVAELDGIRAAALLLVLVNHLNYEWAHHAGAVGVTVFFVLSGYLITTLLAEERESTGSVRLGAFWRRRVVRLLPALVVVLAVFTLPWWPVHIGPWRALGPLAYVSNWLAGRWHVDLEPVTHTWSLSVEEQFYLVWPLVLALLSRVEPRRHLGVLVAALAAVAVWWRLRLPWEYDRLYFGSDALAFAPLVGCALATARGWRRWTPPAPPVATVVLAVSGWYLARWSNESLTWLLQRRLVSVALVTTAVIAVAVTAGSRVLAWRPLVWIGRVSYGVYLWHWPIFKQWEAIAGRPLAGRWWETAPLLALTFAVAVGSKRWIEDPVMRRWRQPIVTP